MRRATIGMLVGSSVTALVVTALVVVPGRSAEAATPITFVGAGTGFTAGASAATTTATVPTTAKPGDILVVSATAERGLVPTLSGVSGLTIDHSAADGTNLSVVSAHKTIAAGDVGATVTATVSAVRRMSLVTAVYRGAASATVVTKAAAKGTTSVSGPVVTPAQDDSVLVSLFGLHANAAPWKAGFTPATGWTERTEVVSTHPTAANAITYVADRTLSGGKGVSQAGHVAGVTLAGARYLSSTFVLAPKTDAAQSEAQRRQRLVLGKDKPDAASTGVLPDVPRTPIYGDVNLTEGQVLQNVDVYGRINVNVANAIIRNVYVHGPQNYVPSGDDHLIRAYRAGAKNLLVEHVTLRPDVPSPRMTGMSGHDFTVRFVDCSRLVDCWQVYNTYTKLADGTYPKYNVNTRIEQSWCHDLSWWSGPSPAGGSKVPHVHPNDDETHNDCVQHQGGGNSFYRGNLFNSRFGRQVGHWRTTGSTEPFTTVPLHSLPDGGPYRPVPDRGNGTGATGRYTWEDQSNLMIGDNVGRSHTLTVTDNWLYGGVFSVNGGGNEWRTGYDLGTFHRNRFDHTQGYQGANPNDTYTLHFGEGMWAGHVDAGAGTANQNIYEDNGRPINVRGD